MGEIFLSRKLRERRLAARLTQAQVAEMAGVSRKTICSIESNYDCGSVTLPVLVRVLAVLGAKIDIVSASPPNLDDLLRENKEIFSGKTENTDATQQNLRRVRKTSTELSLLAKKPTIRMKR